MNRFYIEDKDDLRVLLVNRIVPKRIQYSGRSYEREEFFRSFLIFTLFYKTMNVIIYINTILT